MFLRRETTATVVFQRCFYSIRSAAGAAAVDGRRGRVAWAGTGARTVSVCVGSDHSVPPAAVAAAAAASVSLATTAASSIIISSSSYSSNGSDCSNKNGDEESEHKKHVVSRNTLIILSFSCNQISFNLPSIVLFKIKIDLIL